MPAKILIVEDSLLCANILKIILEREDYTVVLSRDETNLVRIIQEQNIDIVMLNIVLPGASGYELLELLKTTEETTDIPVIIVSSSTSANDVKKALEAGAMDFIRKNSEPIEIIARVRSAIKLKEKQDQLILSSQRDHLTQLYNKRYFNAALEKNIKEIAKFPNGLSLLMMDIDYFKNVNDAYGHTFGDYVLANVANAISKSLKQMDFACRFGGEEFSAILQNVTIFQAYLVAERIRTNVEKIEMNHNGQNVRVTISCGVSHTAGGDAKAGIQLVNEADLALYAAKRGGRNLSMIYDKTLHEG